MYIKVTIYSCKSAAGNRVEMAVNLLFILEFVCRPRCPARSCTFCIVRALLVMGNDSFLLPHLFYSSLGIEDP